MNHPPMPHGQFACPVDPADCRYLMIPGVELPKAKPQVLLSPIVKCTAANPKYAASIKAPEHTGLCCKVEYMLSKLLYNAGVNTYVSPYYDFPNINTLSAFQHEANLVIRDPATLPFAPLKLFISTEKLSSSLSRYNIENSAGLSVLFLKLNDDGPPTWATFDDAADALVDYLFPIMFNGKKLSSAKKFAMTKSLLNNLIADAVKGYEALQKFDNDRGYYLRETMSHFGVDPDIAPDTGKHKIYFDGLGSPDTSHLCELSPYKERQIVRPEGFDLVSNYINDHAAPPDNPDEETDEKTNKKPDEKLDPAILGPFITFMSALV